MRSSLSEKEIVFISKLELKKKYFFTREDIKSNFTSDNEMSVYLHRLRKKGRIVKINRSKYLLIPIKAVNRKWSEHPFILIDEILDSKDYCIVGKAAAKYWKLIDQIPTKYEVWTTKRTGEVKIFHTKIVFKRRRKENLPKNVTKKIYNHQFIITTKGESKKWI